MTRAAEALRAQASALRAQADALEALAAELHAPAADAASSYYTAGDNPLGVRDPRTWTSRLAALGVPAVRLARGRLACRREDLDRALLGAAAPVAQRDPKPANIEQDDPFARGMTPRRTRGGAR